MKNNTMINMSAADQLFQEYCEEHSIEFSDNTFEEFLRFLEIDFYDWVKGNIKQFYQQK